MHENATVVRLCEPCCHIFRIVSLSALKAPVFKCSAVFFLDHDLCQYEHDSSRIESPVMACFFSLISISNVTTPCLLACSYHMHVVIPSSCLDRLSIVGGALHISEGKLAVVVEDLLDNKSDQQRTHSKSKHISIPRILVCSYPSNWACDLHGPRQRSQSSQKPLCRCQSGQLICNLPFTSLRIPSILLYPVTAFWFRHCSRHVWSQSGIASMNYRVIQYHGLISVIRRINPSWLWEVRRTRVTRQHHLDLLRLFSMMVMK